MLGFALRMQSSELPIQPISFKKTIVTDFSIFFEKIKIKGPQEMKKNAKRTINTWFLQIKSEEICTLVKTDGSIYLVCLHTHTKHITLAYLSSTRFVRIVTIYTKGYYIKNTIPHDKKKNNVDDDTAINPSRFNAAAISQQFLSSTLSLPKSTIPASRSVDKSQYSRLTKCFLFAARNIGYTITV